MSEHETRTITIPALSNSTNQVIAYTVEVSVVTGTGLAYHEAIDRISWHVTHLATGRIIPCDFRDVAEALDYIERIGQFVDFTGEVPVLLMPELTTQMWQFLAMLSKGTVATMRGIHFIADVQREKMVAR